VLIDKGEAFVFGSSKLDVMFGRLMPAAARHPYRDLGGDAVRYADSSFA
jgi:sulfide:quinone oxidoreductase